MERPEKRTCASAYATLVSAARSEAEGAFSCAARQQSEEKSSHSVVACAVAGRCASLAQSGVAARASRVRRRKARLGYLASASAREASHPASRGAIITSLRLPSCCVVEQCRYSRAGYCGGIDVLQVRGACGAARERGPATSHWWSRRRHGGSFGRQQRHEEGVRGS